MELAQIYDDLADLVADIASDSIGKFQENIERYGLELTQELKRDFQYRILKTATTLALEIDFKTYGRFKDMKRLRYSHQAPVDELEAFINQIGIDRFAFVQGYKGRSVPSVNNAAKRIAWAMAIGRRKVPSVNRSFSGTWYNSGKMALINSAKKRLGERYSELIAPLIGAEFQKTPT